MINRIVHNSFFYLFVFTLFFGVLLHDMIGFKLMDEISGIILLVIYGIYIFTTKTPKNNTGLFITLLVFVFYLCYSILASYNTHTAIILDFLIQIRPYLTFFIVAQISPSFSESQKALLKRLCFFMWLLFIPIGIYGFINSTFLYSVFGHPSNYIINISSLSLVYLFCSNFSIRERFFFIMMLSAGFLATHTIFYTIFLLTCGILLYFHHSDILKFNLRTGIATGVIILIILHITRIQIATDLLPINNLTAGYDLPVRSALYQTAIDIVSKDFIPLGSGLASFGTDASGLYYSEIYAQYGLSSIDGLTPQNWYSVSDSYYPALAQFGIIGIILYLFFWGGILYKSFATFRQNGDIQPFVLILILTSFVFIENLSDSFLTSNKGYYMMMFLGVLFGKKKSSFYIRDNNKKIEIAPVHTNLQGKNPIQKLHEDEGASPEKEKYQMPPVPIREEDLPEKGKESIEYSFHSSEKNETADDNEIFNDEEDDEDYYDEDEDYYFDDNNDLDEIEDELIYARTASEPENNKAGTESDQANPAGQTEYQESILSNATEKETSSAGAELHSYSSLVDEDDIQDLFPSLQENTDTTEKNTPSVAILKKVRHKIGKIKDTVGHEATNVTESNPDSHITPADDSIKVNQESKSEKNILADEYGNIHIHKINMDVSSEIKSTESSTDKSLITPINEYNKANIDIEDKIFAYQTRLKLNVSESDFVKEYRKIVEEQMSPPQKNEKQDINETNDYIRYLEDFLKPIRQEKTYTYDSREENDEPDKQIDYII